nr:apolipoprotein N-acyltransferase [Candidatus Omnitrophota bacterium]
AGGSVVLDGRSYTRPAGAPFEVALVQGAIPQDLKWQDDNRAATLDLYRDMTRKALGARLIVWPEAALPVLAHEASDYLDAIWRDARAHGSDLILGLLRLDFATNRFYNGMVAFSDGTTWYYKRRLVPFGEFFPVPKFVRGWMRLMSLPYVDMSPGAERQAPLSAAGIHIAPTICYEDAYGSEQLATLGESELLVNVTNNAWFGDSTAPHQQLQRWVKELNYFYKTEPALFHNDFSPAGFEWVNCLDWERGVISFLRKGDEGTEPVLVVCNFTPVPRDNYKVGIPMGGFWREVLNSDAQEYGGSGHGNLGGQEAAPVPLQGKYFSLSLVIPPLAVLFFKRSV